MNAPGPDHTRPHDPSPASFDEQAATWDDDAEKVLRAREVADAIASRVPLGTDLRVLEYGAGTGLLTQAMRDRVGPVVLTDVSEGMLDVMRAKVADGTIRDAEVRRLDLCADPPPQDGFELVTSMLALHHIPDPAPAVAGIHACLVPGGHVALADLDAEDGSFHGHDRDDVHRGFSRERLTHLLTAAGFVDVQVDEATRMTKNDKEFAILLATGRRG